MAPWKTLFHYKQVVFHFHVSSREGTPCSALCRPMQPVEFVSKPRDLLGIDFARSAEEPVAWRIGYYDQPRSWEDTGPEPGEENSITRRFAEQESYMLPDACLQLDLPSLRRAPGRPWLCEETQPRSLVNFVNFDATNESSSSKFLLIIWHRLSQAPSLTPPRSLNAEGKQAYAGERVSPPQDHRNNSRNASIS